jgi:hypothetical protein
VDELREGVRRLLPDPLRGAVGRDQIGVLRLQKAQLALELVVLLVADLRAVEDVVQPLVPADLGAKLVDARRGLRAAEVVVGSGRLNIRAPG